MERNVSDLAADEFDVLVIGGGVLGAAVAWRAAESGLHTALIEARDFAAGSSGNSLKILHGGFRHLKDFTLARARRSARARRFWLRAAPHLVEPLPFVSPISGEGLERRGLVRAALALNDLIAWDRNSDVVEDRRLSGGEILDRREAGARVPVLADTGSQDAALFHDAVMYSPERLVLEVVLAAARAGATVANHVEAVGPVGGEGATPRRIEATDHLTGERFSIRANAVVNTTGARARDLSERLVPGIESRRRPRAVALNLVLKRTGHEVAFTFRTRDGRSGLMPEESRHVVVLPWRNRTLVGTAYYRLEAPDSPSTDPSILGERFRVEIQEQLPRLGASPDEVLGVDSGILPLGRDSGGRLRLRKRPEVDVHAMDGGWPLLTAVTEKFTTAPALAREVVNRLFRLKGHDRPPDPAPGSLLPGGTREPVGALVSEATVDFPDLDGNVLRHLVRSYGTHYRDVLSMEGLPPDGNGRVVDGSPVIRAQLWYAVRHEMARTVDDLLERRTELGPVRRRTPEAERLAAAVLRRHQESP